MRETDFNRIDGFFNGSFQFGVHAYSQLKSVVWGVLGEANSVPYLRSQNLKGHSIFIRPLPKITEYYMLVDDLDSEMVMCHYDKPGRLIVESSPRNFQVWIRSDAPLSDGIKKVLLQELQSDPGAAPAKRWGRAPGFTNRKPKHLMSNGLFPYAKLHYVDCRPAAIELPILSPMPETTAGRASLRRVAAAEILRSDYETGDESRTDIRFCLALMRRGLSDMEIRARLIEERPDWLSHQGGNRLEKYIERTLAKVREWIREPPP